jgi:hypothetical protein
LQLIGLGGVKLGLLFDFLETDPELADFLAQALGLVADATDVLEAAFWLLWVRGNLRFELFPHRFFFRWGITQRYIINVIGEVDVVRLR